MEEKQQHDIRLNGFGFFDAKLRCEGDWNSPNKNAVIIISLNIHLKPNELSVTITDDDGNQFNTGIWPTEKWKKFKETFVKTATDFWDGKFWLKTPENYTSLNFNSTPLKTQVVSEIKRNCFLGPFGCENVEYKRIEIQRNMVRPNIECRFEINLTDIDLLDFAHTIYVNYIVSKISNGKDVKIKEGEPSGFRSSAHNYSQSDIELIERKYIVESQTPLYSITTFKIPYKVILHEVGHLMGLEHIGVANGELLCKAEIDKDEIKGSNKNICYGATLESFSDVMGGGMSLSVTDAMPWQRAISILTNTKREDWKVSKVLLFPEHI